jgi:hypothetical protein
MQFILRHGAEQMAALPGIVARTSTAARRYRKAKAQPKSPYPGVSTIKSVRPYGSTDLH